MSKPGYSVAARRWNESVGPADVKISLQAIDEDGARILRHLLFERENVTKKGHYRD
jgi:hypothetical protein